MAGWIITIFILILAILITLITVFGNTMSDAPTKPFEGLSLIIASWIIVILIVGYKLIG